MKHDVAVIGLGYVGLTFAAALADVGFDVLGVEKRPEIVTQTNAGVPHFSEFGLEGVLKHVLSEGNLLAVPCLPKDSHAEIYVITVGTPLKNGRFNLDFIKSAAEEVADNMRDGVLIILRSTVAIGTARNVVIPILEATGKKFQIAMCPERTLEGRAMSELRSLPQIIGADDDQTRQRAAHFFYRLTHTVVPVSSLESAEVVKLIDNTFRDVQFGFANEVARICDAYGINALEVINGGKLGYPRTNVALPGLVGGPCLEKDPHILAQSLEMKGLNLEITQAARKVNERQPSETVEFISGLLSARKGRKKPVVALAGVAFKGVPATDDLRGSMAHKILSSIREQIPHAEIRVYDPVCGLDYMKREGVNADKFCATLQDAISGADCLIIANNHPALGELTPVQIAKYLQNDGFVYDYWNHFSDLRAREIGNSYFAVGNTRQGV
ncbi:nucleotide sugar dehydrogenase [Alphaproteobacteria bacterium]|nr:nucleotide sugar dehydrogenase [Alphaproteobacteria bacterium]